MMVTVNTLKATAVDKIPSDLEGMEASMQHLLALIEDIYKYVDDVVVCKHCFLSLIILSFFIFEIVFIFFFFSRHIRKGVLNQTTTLGDLYLML